ncbi:MAG: ADP-ribosylglycohydrolase family protein [Planctomycetota bacterium]
MPSALAALDGLSVGDAFGQRFFIDAAIVTRRVAQRALPDGRWWVTDDTWMALSVVEVLRRAGRIDQDQLARSFAGHYHPSRGYGGGMRSLLERLRIGQPWQEASAAQFDGLGSFGNGGAMRVAPLGAWYADDVDAAAAEAARSAAVTHAHPEGVAGAVAVAVAAALAWQSRDTQIDPTTWLLAIAERTPAGDTAAGIREAAEVAPDTPIAHAAARLGNGERLSAMDTVPFSLWMAATREADFATAMFDTVSALGDRDTTCAIVGGVLAARHGRECIPPAWLEHREPLPDWTV